MLEVATTGNLPEVTSANKLTEVSATGSPPKVTSCDKLPEVSATGSPPEVTPTGSLPEVTATGSLPEVTHTGSLPEVTASGSHPEVTTTSSLPKGKHVTCPTCNKRTPRKRMRKAESIWICCTCWLKARYLTFLSWSLFITSFFKENIVTGDKQIKTVHQELVKEIQVKHAWNPKGTFLIRLMYNFKSTNT